MPCETWRGTERSRHGPFAPPAGIRCRQADEGLPPAQSRAAGQSLAFLSISALDPGMKSLNLVLPCLQLKTAPGSGATWTSRISRPGRMAQP
ncbi:hypothetical protein E0H66_23850 [Rhizobium leguminosarum bv. viciae]|nr:hypothetical protein E0H66_23850 [Rhizobium leguminosarum bv. viciae]